MSGHFSKKLYDDCYFKEVVRQEIAPGNYRLFTNEWKNDSACHSAIGPRSNRPSRIGSTGEFDAGNMVKRTEVESILSDRGWDNTKCAPANLLAVKNAALKKAYQDFIPNNKLCNNYLDYKHSRLDSNTKDYTYADYNRWYDTIIDPKEWVFYGNKVTNDKDRFGVQSRYETKKILDDFNKKIRVNA
jgi:hypothetical protein